MNEDEALRHLTVQLEQIERTLGRMVSFGSSDAKRLIERKHVLEQEIANHESLREARRASMARAVPKQLEPAQGSTNSPTSERELFVMPILMTKGWSIHDWAVNSDVDFHTASGYLKGRTKPYRSTRKKLAESLDVKVEELPQ